MSSDQRPVRVLYSFPHKLGAERICYTAWQQINGLAAAGADVLAFPGVLYRSVSASVRVCPTLARGRLRIPYKLIGTLRALAFHDHIVSRRMEKLVGQIDIVHTWPLSALKTLEAARRLGIPTVMERPNAHTRFSMEVVRRECDRLGVTLPSHHEHAYNVEKLRIEEDEYRRAYRLLCPSEFVVETFLERGFTRDMLARHTYGFDEKVYYPASVPKDPRRGLAMLFVGVCAVRKGLHFALEAWLRSPARHDGTFLVAGDFLPQYAIKLAPMLSHPSVRVLGHRGDVPELMRKSDILVLPSIEEGFGLVCADAIGTGCVPLVSTACTDICKHLDNALVHPVGDVDMLTRHITMLHKDRELLERLRASCLRTAPKFTWTAAGARLLQTYREVIAAKQDEQAIVDRDGAKTARCLA